MERLTAADLSMVWPEDFGWPQDIGALAILDGSASLDEHGRLPIERIRDQIERRLHLVPRFRQLLYMPPKGLGWPLWWTRHRSIVHVAVREAVAPEQQPSRDQQHDGEHHPC
jgi:Wax ester synthase-like Acyl-CoA acyltransferase domain